MTAPVNRFKQKLKGSTMQYGCWVGLADSYAAEISAQAGFDWLLVDGEHAPNDLRSIMQQLQVIAASNSDAIVRLPVADTALIKQMLDAGAQSLLIPMVDSAEQAAAVVKATRYPPDGIRGVGSALARASHFNAIPDYLTTANQEICVIVQIESCAAIDALDDILAVEGIDGAFIGPADLAADMGFIDNAKAPEVMDVIENTLKKISASNVAAGILAMDKDFIARSEAAGATFIGVGVDVILFADAMRSLAKNPTMR